MSRGGPGGADGREPAPGRKVSRRAFLAGLGGAGALAGGALLVRPYLSGRPAPLRLGSPRDLGAGGRLDVCIVGSGPAGAVLGRELVERGFRVVILESGLDLRTQAFDPRVRELEVYRSSGPIDYPIAATRVRGVGGTSIVWTGACTRFHAIDFEPNPYTPDAIWPIRYADVEPWYERADDTLHVRRGVFASWHPTLSARLEDVGVQVGGSPKSRQRLWSGPTRAAQDMLPAFADSDSGTLASGLTVTRLLADASGRVAGAEARTLDGARLIVRARAYVVACGALESARLLLLSRSPGRPEGLGNASGAVGRHFMEHTGSGFNGRVRGWSTRRTEFGRSDQFYEAFKRKGLGGVILIFRRQPGDGSPLNIGAGTEMAPNPENRVTLAPDLRDAFGSPGLDLRFGFSPVDLRTIEETRTLIRRIFADLGAEDVKEVEGGTEDWGHHHIGTCRMGDDPRTSVVDRDLRVHGTPNAYVLSSGVFATGGAAHPTLLIVALAHRLADHLTRRLEGTGAAELTHRREAPPALAVRS